MKLNHLSENSHIFSMNDFDMHYEIHGTGTPLLLLHGFTGSGADLLSLFTPFLKHYQLIVPDLRGHGRSTNPSQKYTFKQSALDVLALLRHLNIDKCNAVGFSGGGCTLLHMATMQDNLIQSMALISATTHFPQQARKIMQQFTIESRAVNDWESMRRIHYHGDEQIKMLWRQASSFSEDKDDMNFTSSQLLTITAKTLIMQGDRDPLYPIDITIDMYKSIPNAYLWITPNAGHGALTDKLKPFFLGYLLDFFSENSHMNSHPK